MLDPLAASDNHSEEHTVVEALEFCPNGRTDTTGERAFQGTGQYAAARVRQGHVAAPSLLAGGRGLP